MNQLIVFMICLVFGGKDKAQGFLILKTILVSSHYMTMSNMILPAAPETGK